MLKVATLTFSFLLLFPLVSHGQYIPLDNQFYSLLTQKYQDKNISLISSMKPLLLQDLDSVDVIDKMLYEIPGNSKNKSKLFYRKLYSENLLRYKTKEFSITADPVFNFGLGHDFKAS